MSETVQATATPTGTPTPPAPVNTLKDIIATAEARAAGQTPPASATEPTASKTEPAKGPSIDIDPQTLKQISRLQKEKRELADKAKRLEEPEIVAAIEAAQLLKDGKRLEAIARLSGKDPDAELVSLLEGFIEESSDPKTPENQLAKRVDEIAKQLEEDKKTRLANDEKVKTAQFEAEKAQAVEFAVKQIDAAKFELCAKPENRDEAAQFALDAVVFMAGDRNLDLEKLDEKATAALFTEAYDAIERQYEKVGQRFAKSGKRQSTESFEAASLPGPGISTTTPSKVMTIDEVIALAEERARQAA